MTQDKFKQCAANDCTKPGIHSLTVLYLNKTGYFCESCKNELLKEGLVIDCKCKGRSAAELNEAEHLSGRHSRAITTGVSQNNG